MVSARDVRESATTRENEKRRSVDDGVGEPALIGKRALVPANIVDVGLIRASRGFVKTSDKGVEIAKSEKFAKEFKMNGIAVFVLNAAMEVRATTAKSCGEDEYMFLRNQQGEVCIWKGGVSSFEDGDNHVLFHRPHIVVDASKAGDMAIALHTDIHSFDLVRVIKILQQSGVLATGDGEESDE